ncbi:MAG: hypothetical protein ABI539_12125, partial [Acidobacteriota bacterium]
MRATLEEKEGPQIIRAPDLIFFVAVFAFLSTQLFQLPLTPIFFEGDHLISVTNAVRMLNGEVIYKDFFHLTTPGTELLYCGLFAIFGAKIWILNAVILVLGMVQVWLIWYFSRPLVSGALRYLPSVVFLVLGYRVYGIDGSYRILSVVLILFAIAVLYHRKTNFALAAAGILCGLSTMVVQTRGLSGMAAIGCFLIWDAYRDKTGLKQLSFDAVYLSVPFVLTVAATQSYFIWQAGFENYYFSLITFPLVYYPSDPLAKFSSYLTDFPDLRVYFNLFPPVTALWRYFRIVLPPTFLYLLVPWVYVVLLLIRRVKPTLIKNFQTNRRLMLLLFAGVMLAAGISAPTGYRFYHVAIPAIVILFWLLSQLRLPVRIWATLLLLFSAWAGAYAVQRQIVNKYDLNMPAGNAAFLGLQTYQKYLWVKDHLEPGEVFYEAFHPSFYFPFYLKNPTQLY